MQIVEIVKIAIVQIKVQNTPTKPSVLKLERQIQSNMKDDQELPDAPAKYYKNQN